MKMSKSKVHDEFNIKMQEARQLYIRQNYDVPELDMERLKHVYKDSRRKTSRYTLKIAAMLAVVLLCGMSIGVWINGDGAYGGQNIINKCLTIVAPDDNTSVISEDDTESSERIIEDESEADAALGKLVLAHKPGYLPDGYAFEHLSIVELYDPDETLVEFSYKKGAIPLFVSFHYYEYANQDITVVGRLYTSPVTGQDMYIDEIEDTGEYTVIAVTDKYDCCVTGIGNVEEGVKIMESVFQYH